MALRLDPRTGQFIEEFDDEALAQWRINEARSAYDAKASNARINAARSAYEAKRNDYMGPAWGPSGRPVYSEQVGQSYQNWLASLGGTPKTDADVLPLNMTPPALSPTGEPLTPPGAYTGTDPSESYWSKEQDSKASWLKYNDNEKYTNWLGDREQGGGYGSDYTPPDTYGSSPPYGEDDDLWSANKSKAQAKYAGTVSSLLGK